MYSFLFPCGFSGVNWDVLCFCDSVVIFITVLHHHHLGEHLCYLFLKLRTGKSKWTMLSEGVLCGSNHHDWTDFSKIGSSPTGSNFLFVEKKVKWSKESLVLWVVWVFLVTRVWYGFYKQVMRRKNVSNTQVFHFVWRSLWWLFGIIFHRPRAWGFFNPSNVKCSTQKLCQHASKRLDALFGDFLRIVIPWDSSPFCTNIWENICGTFPKHRTSRKSENTNLDVPGS